jgi:aspartyl-tRNA synthetase
VGITVGMDNRLNFRWIDTRTPANQAIFRIQHGVSQLFREVRLS